MRLKAKLSFGKTSQRPIYRPGVRSADWLKVKPKLTLPVMVTGGSSEKIAWGDWGTAVHRTFTYAHPRTNTRMEIDQTVRVPRELPFELHRGRVGEIVCWGIMPSGMLRHPLFVGWLSTPAV